MASAMTPPFLVTPNDRMSTPDFQVTSAGLQPSRATALAKRAPSMCTFRPCARAIAVKRGDLVEPVDRAEIGRLHQVEGRRLALVRQADAGAGERLAQAPPDRPCRAAPATGTSLVPPPKKPVALHSDVSICAFGLQ